LHLNKYILACSTLYINVGTGRKESNNHYCQCSCASKIKDLENILAHCQLTIENLTKKLDDSLSEKSFVSDENTKFCTGLPNAFDHVCKDLPPEGATKLSCLKNSCACLSN